MCEDDLQEGARSAGMAGLPSFQAPGCQVAQVQLDPAPAFSIAWKQAAH